MHMLAVSATEPKATDILQIDATRECVSDTRQHPFTIVGHDTGDFGNEKWCGVRGSRVTADDDCDLRRPRANPPDEREHVVGFECMHRGDADECGPCALHVR